MSVVRPGLEGAKGEDSVAVLTLRAIAAKPKAEIKLLSVTPVTVGDKAVSATLPPSFAIDVVN